MAISRRCFLKVSLATGVAAGAGVMLRPPKAHAFCQTQPLRKFIQPLPRLGPKGIPVAAPDKQTYPGVDFYRIMVGEYTQQLHPDLPKQSRLWGYADVTAGGAPNFKHLGGVIVAKRGTPVRIQFINALPMTPPAGYQSIHPLPVDVTIPGAGTRQLQNRIAVHLHGGFIPWMCDGGPFHWFAPDGTCGSSVVKWLPDSQGNLTDDYYYPNLESARLMWYHDHAVGITRLNAYAGIASGYVVRDDFEASLVATGGLPDFVEKGGREIPLVIQDKIFMNNAYPDPNYIWGHAGDLWYPSRYDPKLWMWQKGKPKPKVPSVVPEFYGDTMLVNGVAYPRVTLEPRRYRLRILNACNARFCTLRLVEADPKTPTEPRMKAGKVVPGPAFIQIGTEGGFLYKPVRLDGKTLATTLLLAPAERADIIVDFKGAPPGATYILYNDASAPYPVGAPINDYYPGAVGNPTVSRPGKGPNTRTLMQIRIGKATGPADPPLKLNLQVDPALLVPPGVTTPPPGATKRHITLNEGFDSYGRLITELGTNVPLRGKAFGRRYIDPPTETPKAGDIEVWYLTNLSADAHPMHFHLANVQVLWRRPFNAVQYKGTPNYTGPIIPPPANEIGWKETVVCYPGEVTAVVMQWNLPPGPAGVTIPKSPRTGGHEYVYHCHILEHEEHDMMRPLVVM